VSQEPLPALRPPVGDKIIMTPPSAQLHTVHDLAEPGQLAPIDLTIFVSCYNESEFSKDNSADLVEAYIKDHPEDRIILRRNGKNRGLAQNYVDAAFLGKGKYYRLICGDNAEPEDTMIAVFSAIGEADMIIPYYVSFEGKSAFRQQLTKVYAGIVNFVSGLKLHYYNGLAVHLRYNIMRWHPNTRGFGFQADIICVLADQGFTMKEVAVRTVELKKGASVALNYKNVLSVGHTIFDIMLRRIANWIYRPSKKSYR
jgi:glycosyltransferase involved in cell wall biosynthesis